MKELLRGARDHAFDWGTRVLLTLALIALAFSQPLLVYIVWRLHIPAVDVQNAQADGAIMGTVFTAGGLIVGMIALFTLTTIERTARRAVQPLLKDVPATIDRRIEEQLHGYDCYLRARFVQSNTLVALEAIDHLVNEAQQYAPHIPGLRTWVAKRHYCAIVNAVGNTVRTVVVPPMLSLPPPGRPMALCMTQNDLPGAVATALKWCEHALAACEPEERGELCAERAELRALIGAPMRHVIKDIREANHDDRRLPSGTMSLIMLSYACRLPREAQQLGQALAVPIPMNEPDLLNVLVRRQPAALASAYAATIELLVVPLSAQQAVDDPARPAILSVVYHASGMACVRWIPQAQPSALRELAGIPPFERDAKGIQVKQPPLSFEDLTKELLARFCVLCELPSVHQLSIPERVEALP